jgi:hypothetical protein
MPIDIFSATNRSESIARSASIANMHDIPWMIWSVNADVTDVKSLNLETDATVWDSVSLMATKAINL